MEFIGDEDDSCGLILYWFFFFVFVGGLRLFSGVFVGVGRFGGCGVLGSFNLVCRGGLGGFGGVVWEVGVGKGRVGRYSRR